MATKGRIASSTTPHTKAVAAQRPSGPARRMGGALRATVAKRRRAR